MGALVRLEVAERDGAGLRAAVDLVDVRFAPPEDAEEEALGDFDRDAGDVCFVATGVRDSLVALSARQSQWYWSDRSDVGITAGFLPRQPDPR